MNTPQQIHARITIPAECLPLVTELVVRLGGNITGTDEGGTAIQLMPEIERGGKMLRALRLRAGMTQQAVADALGLPQSHVCEFEKNRRAIPYKHAHKLATLLHSIPSHFMAPNAAAAADGAEEDERQMSDPPETMYKDLGILSEILEYSQRPWERAMPGAKDKFDAKR